MRTTLFEAVCKLILFVGIAGLTALAIIAAVWAIIWLCTTYYDWFVQSPVANGLITAGACIVLVFLGCLGLVFSERR